MRLETRFRRSKVTAALGLLAALLTVAPAANAAAVPQDLTDAATADPAASFDVIVDSSDAEGSAAQATTDVLAAIPADGEGITRRYSVIDGVTAHLSGAQVLALAGDGRVSSILPDAEMHPTTFTNAQAWPAASEVNKTWKKGNAPTIAIVDSGIDATRADFGQSTSDPQVAKSVDFTGGVNNSRGDGYGHGTFVAGIAAGRATNFAGASPSSHLVSLDVFDDDGNGTLGEVIAAADWIYRNAGAYNIKVANFSLTGSTPSSFTNDPLDKAVEKLWLKNIVVVAAAGNYAVDGAASGVLYAPGNDPFVITVGAFGDNGTAIQTDDVIAPWSAHGYTPDGFYKPEVGAPGRVLYGPVPTASTMYGDHADHIDPNNSQYFWMSGTSFAAPIVSGAAADLIAAHPNWLPDQIKGALMLTARQGAAHDFAYGVGGIKTAHASALLNGQPPNPNAGLDTLLIPDPNDPGTQVFDTASWESLASGDASWESASWESASWQSASWESASWESASWESGFWDSQDWPGGMPPQGGTSVGLDAIWVP